MLVQNDGTGNHSGKDAEVQNAIVMIVGTLQWYYY